MSFSYQKAKQALMEEQNNIKQQLQRLHDSAKHESIGYGNHMADDATEAFDQAVDEALMREAESALEEINVALRKLDNGTYGLCETCGARIERARLEVLPQARHCMTCQSRQEHRGK